MTYQSTSKSALSSTQRANLDLATLVFDALMSRPRRTPFATCPLWAKSPSLQQPEPVSTQLLSFTEYEVRNPHCGVTIDRLMQLSDSSQSCADNFNAFTLDFPGFDAHADLSNVPEIRTFLLTISSQWNFWLHFLQPTHHNLQTILRIHKSAKNDSITAASTPSLAHAVNVLHDTMRIPHHITHKLGHDLIAQFK